MMTDFHDFPAEFGNTSEPFLGKDLEMTLLLQEEKKEANACADGA